MGMGKGMVVITAMQANSRAGMYLEKELYKKMQRRGMMNLGKKIHISRI
jgi:hypothetical protein